jgi:hypothetical protein
MKKLLLLVAVTLAVFLALLIRGRDERGTTGLSPSAEVATSEVRLVPEDDAVAPRERLAALGASGGVANDSVAKPVHAASELVYFGRVVAVEDALPIPGARVEVRSAVLPSRTRGELEAPPEFEAVADGNGEFELRLPMPRSFQARIEAPGRSPLLLLPGSGHEDRPRAVTHRMIAAATLDVRVLGENDEPTAGVEVVVSTQTLTTLRITQATSGFVTTCDLAWSATTDEHGACSLDDVPALVPLTVIAWRDGELLRERRALLRLAPGERRTLILPTASVRVLGELVDLDGVPAAKHRVAYEDESSRRPGPTGRYSEPGPAIECDEHGRFEIENAKPGALWIVPLAPEFGGAPPGIVLAPLASVFEISASEPVVEIVVRAPRALALRGVVLDPDGRPARDVDVSAKDSEMSIRLVHARTDANGRFELTPLAPCEMRVAATTSDRRHVAAERIVPAGTENVVLRLAHGARIAGEVIDPAGGVRVVCVGPAESASAGPVRISIGGGVFDFHALAAGSYAIHALHVDGRASQPVEVVVGEGHVVEGLELALAPAARLVLKPPEHEGALRLEIANERGAIGTLSIPAGSSEVQDVPTGDIVLRGRFESGLPLRTARFSVAADELRVVALEPGD